MTKEELREKRRIWGKQGADGRDKDLPPFDVRFWGRVNRGATDECWLWHGRIAKNGYGAFTYRGIPKDRPLETYAHRIMWALTNGPIPKGLYVCHKCDNPACVNPNHLFLGTQHDNILDAFKKGRLPMPTFNGKVQIGESHRTAKLKEFQVFEIRERLNNGEQQRAVAKLYGVDETTIGNIRHRRTWKHI